MSTTRDVRTIDPLEVKRLLDTGYDIELIDVRTPAEFRGVHATAARNIPLDRIDAKAMITERGKDSLEPLYFICRSDNRGKKACEAFIAEGYSNVVNIAGGTVAWDDLRLPVVRGKQTISLERQVPIAAGLLVVTGAALSILSPWWIALSAFVGAGLVFAGITDNCVMARLLAKMPWNQVRPSDVGGATGVSQVPDPS
jgi:rhodanese-related sulfurtransferase